VEDGSTLQLGIGEIPNAAALSLRNKKNLGVHTEMMVDSMMELTKWV
jgi:acyl-CoA hydrolase